MKLVACFVLILSISICPRDAGASDLQEIWKPTDEGWFDVDLTITSVSEDDDHLFVTARGLFRGSPVGLRIHFLKGMKPGLPDGEPDSTAFAEGGIAYESIGVESDRLLRAIAELYGLEPFNRQFAAQVPVTSIALEQYPFDVSKNAVRFKVFFNTNGREDSYAELFTNIDLPNRRLELHEKDEGYRSNVVRALTAP